MRLIVTLIMAAALGLISLAGCGGHAESKPRVQTRTEPKAETDSTMVDYRHIPFKTITGQETSLSDYAGKVILIVNTASKCGYTKQYVGLEELYREKKDAGLVILAFPSNDFGEQEPGTNDEIQKFCQGTFDVTFPLMAKIHVTGDDINPLFKYLTQESPLPGKVTWNFNKFLLDRKGNLVARFESSVEPDDAELVTKINDLL